MRPLLFAALLAVPAAAQTVYSWEDANGVHYTDDINQVPAKARVNATMMQQAPKPAARPEQQQNAVVVAQPQAQPAPVEARRRPDERDWRDRFVTAHRKIGTLEQSITALQRSLPQRIDCVAQPMVLVGQVQVGNQPGAPITTAPGSQVVTQNGYTTVVNDDDVNGRRIRTPTATCAVNQEHDRIVREIELKQVELKDAKLDLEQLDRNASYEGVPREWRRGW